MSEKSLRKIIRKIIVTERLGSGAGKGWGETPYSISTIGLRGGRKTSLQGDNPPFDMPANAEFLKKILPNTPLDRMHPDMLKFITAVPSAIAALGHAKDEAEAIKKAERMIGSTYRDAKSQAHAMYNWPYKHDLKYRNKGCNPGHYFFASKTGKCASAPTGGVYGSKQQWQDIFDAFETSSGGNLGGHKPGEGSAIGQATGILNQNDYSKESTGHGGGRAFDLPGGQSGQYDDILEKAKEISGVDYKAFTEVDHYHVNLAERSKK